MTYYLQVCIAKKFERKIPNITLGSPLGIIFHGLRLSSYSGQAGSGSRAFSESVRANTGIFSYIEDQ